MKRTLPTPMQSGFLPGQKVKCLYRQEVICEGELGFSENEILTILGADGSTWYMARNCSGNEGLIPASSVVKHDDFSATLDNTSAEDGMDISETISHWLETFPKTDYNKCYEMSVKKETKQLMSQNKNPMKEKDDWTEGQMLKCLANFSSDRGDELSFSKGEILIILREESVDEDRCFAMNIVGKEGWIPKMHVQLNEDWNDWKPGVMVECLWEYKTAKEDELSFSKWEILTIVEPKNKWCLARNNKGAVGLIPINRVLIFQDQRWNPGQKIRCLYTFAGPNEDAIDLHFTKGEILTIVKATKSINRYIAKNEAGITGIIPTRYVQINEDLDTLPRFLEKTECAASERMLLYRQHRTKVADVLCTRRVYPCLKQDTKSSENNGAASKTRVEGNVSVNQGSFSVKIYSGALADWRADVLVCSCSPDLNLSKGGLAQSLLQKAGSQLQDECNFKYPHGIEKEQVAVAKGYNLYCKKVYFGTLSSWSGDGSCCKKELAVFVSECLKLAHLYNMKSVAFPALGTGNLKYPPQVSASIIHTCVEDFCKLNPSSNFLIYIVVYDQSLDGKTVKQAFDQEWASRARNPLIIQCSSLRSPPPLRPPEAANKTQVEGNVSVNQGSNSVKIYSGTLADWRADVLVCSCSPDLNLSKGGLAQSLLQKAGSQLQDECKVKYPHGIQKEQVAVAKGYNLYCKKVYFGTLPSWSGDGSTCKKELAAFVCECLKLAHLYNMKSVAFPALGTGNLKYPPQVSASIIRTCVEDFCKQYPSSNFLIYIVVYDQRLDVKTVKQAFDQEWTSRAGNPLIIQCSSLQLPLRLLPPQVPATHKPKSKAKPSRKDIKEYFTYKYQSEPKTPKYWEKFHHMKTVKKWNCSKGDLSLQIFQVTGSALSDIIELVNDTLKEQPSSDFTNITVKEVQRLENLQLFETYASFRNFQFSKVSKTGKLPPLEHIMQSKKGLPLTFKRLKRGCILDQNIYPEVNEHYLFHGTKAVSLESIFQQGLDNRLAGSGCFGNGIYCAETPAKSNMYTDQAEEKKMFLVRACLGEIYIHNGENYKFKRAPCKTCQKDQCSCGKPLYNSIVAEGKLPYREFILYDRYQVYPEYLITYTCS